ncbi:MAG: hydroxysqualene dehydroxylase HpnE [Polaromonas sp.]|nr:hydroxysqualene dehydroxylase HpnE [Polaromonas sp.]
MKVAVVGAGWAGCAAAVEATQCGHQVTLFESARIAGGRARRVETTVAGEPLQIDNGQHILIGAYAETLRLMSTLGVDTLSSLLRLPLRLQFPNGDGLSFPAWRVPAAVQALIGILGARGWAWQDKWSLLRLARRWQAGGFECPTEMSVAALCVGLSPRAMAGLIEPLCVSALNTPAERASAQVFLRVMQDALFSQAGASDLLLPRTDLSTLLPDAALRWLTQCGPAPRLGLRVETLTFGSKGWRISLRGGDVQGNDEIFDAVILACPATEAARLVKTATMPAAFQAETAHWIALTHSLQYEALATVYAQVSSATRNVTTASLSQPMLALPSSPEEPAQFVFDRGQLGGPTGLLAFVVSASQGDTAHISAQVLAQGQRQLGLPLELVQTIVEKRATFACTPNLQRPGTQIAPGLLACGDYIAGPYPATLEGAVRSGLEAAKLLG